jgi:PAS domain S-box-containing protein
MMLVPDAVTLTDRKGNIIYSNELAGKSFGIPNNEVVGMNALDFVIESEHQETLQNFIAAAESDQVITQTFHGKRRNGEIFSVDGSTKAMRDEYGNVIGFMIITRDITEKIANEKKIRDLLAESEKRELMLKESEERYRFVAEHANDIITVTDVNGVFKYVSPSIKNVIGLEPADLIGKRSIIELPLARDRK